MKSIFQVACLIAAPDEREMHTPWVVIETYWTSDGPRTRFCNGRWNTQEEAEAERALRMKGPTP